MSVGYKRSLDAVNLIEEAIGCLRLSLAHTNWAMPYLIEAMDKLRSAQIILIDPREQKEEANESLRSDQAA